MSTQARPVASSRVGLETSRPPLHLHSLLLVCRRHGRSSWASRCKTRCAGTALAVISRKALGCSRSLAHHRCWLTLTPRSAGGGQLGAEERLKRAHARRRHAWSDRRLSCAHPLSQSLVNVVVRKQRICWRQRGVEVTDGSGCGGKGTRLSTSMRIGCVVSRTERACKTTGRMSGGKVSRHLGDDHERIILPRGAPTRP